MNGTLCYLMVAFRMLAKAPWTARMVCVHVRQAALYAISKDWFFHTLTSHGIQFSRAELALAAGTFLGDLTPNLPDDPDQPLFLIIHELPHICADLFSTGKAVCKCGGQTKSMPVPTFASAISWSTPEWRSLKHCLEQDCTPFPWILNPKDISWHGKNCERQDVDVIDVQIGPWAYVSLRGESINDFPTYSTVTEILQDTSLSSQGLMIRAMVCCNLLETGARHFWLLEIDNGKPVGLFDSLQGLMPVTLEATRKLRITGFLLAKTQTCCPVLKSKELELVAGKLGRNAQVFQLLCEAELPGFVPHTKDHPDLLQKSRKPLPSEALQHKSSLAGFLVVPMDIPELSLLLRHTLTSVRKIQESAIGVQKSQLRMGLNLVSAPMCQRVPVHRVRIMEQVRR